MREININIEGYNVNGICIGCLNYNRKMFHKDEIGDFLKLLCNIEVPLGISLQICWECRAHLENVKKFQKQLLKCYEVLLDYSRQQKFLNCPTDFTKHAATGLTVKQGYTVDICVQHASLDTNGGSDSLEDKSRFKMEVDVESEVIDADVKTECEETDAVAIDALSDYEDPIKNETDSSEKIVKNTKTTTRKRRMKKKLKPSKNDKQKLKSAVNAVKITEEELLQEREQIRNHVDFALAEYKCDNCLVNFKSKEECEGHYELKHNAVGGYPCSVCNTVWSNRSLCEDHYQTHFNRYDCGMCQQRFACSGSNRLQYKALRRHFAEKHSCDVCHTVFYSPEELQKHPSHKTRVPCPQCDKTFSHRAGLMNHRVAMHEGKVEYPCSICSKVFRWRNSLKRHVENQHQKSTSRAPAAYCDTCHISFNYICSYQRHLRNSLRHVTHDQLRFTCDHCNRKFADKTKLRYHIEEKHLHKTYQCHICFKASSNRSHLEQHVRNVHVGRPRDKMCSHCGHGFPTKLQLESHLRTHTGERLFICEVCPTSFTQRPNLYKHKRQVHLNIKSKRYPVQKKKKEDGSQSVTDQLQVTWT